MLLKNSGYFGLEKEFVASAVTHYMLRGLSKVSGFPVIGKFKIHGEKAFFVTKVSGCPPFKNEVDLDLSTVKEAMSGTAHVIAWVISEIGITSREWHVLLSVGPTKELANDGLNEQIIQSFFKAEGVVTEEQFRPIKECFERDYNFTE